MKRVFLFFLFCSWKLSASSLIQVDAEGVRRDYYSFDTVCETMGHKHSLLVEAVPPAILDCMGARVSLTEFCQKVHPEARPPLLRGMIDPLEKKKIICESGIAATVRVDCSQKSAELEGFCLPAPKACAKLKNIFAIGLEAFHESGSADERINCYFTEKIEANAEEFLIPPLSEVESL